MSDISSSSRPGDFSLEDLIQDASALLHQAQRAEVAKSQESLTQAVKKLSDSLANLEKTDLKRESHKIDFSKESQQIAHAISLLNAQTNPNEGNIMMLIASLVDVAEGLEGIVENPKKPKKVQRKEPPSRA